MKGNKLTIDDLISQVENELPTGNCTKFSSSKSDLIAYGAGDIADECEE